MSSPWTFTKLPFYYRGIYILCFRNRKFIEYDLYMANMQHGIFSNTRTFIFLSLGLPSIKEPKKQWLQMGFSKTKNRGTGRVGKEGNAWPHGATVSVGPVFLTVGVWIWCPKTPVVYAILQRANWKQIGQTGSQAAKKTSTAVKWERKVGRGCYTLTCSALLLVLIW